MSSTGAIISAYGQGNIKITFFDNLHNPVDAQEVTGVKSGSYRWSINPLNIGGLQKYAFSIENKGFLMVQVNWNGQTENLTSGANTIAFDLWNSTSYKPTKTDAPPGQHVGGITLLEQA
ncbi:MAG: hypothetical protein J3R72DRAFT_472478 [Linnemannia gamsii]|nr:hypothetical protein BGX24_003103 [Mortierella sp. AD032]KAK3809865.1 MAG: hypothetical protein J3R72DRAFT_499090 [Linnemannia gamsii]KAK3845606.1 MAG: hypothetical protein J3R72DRAFT_472478 [Linnemannia gamsii]